MSKPSVKSMGQKEYAVKQFVAIIAFITFLIGTFFSAVLLNFAKPVNENAFPDQATIRFFNGDASPLIVDIASGGTVTFANNDSAPHWPASNIHPTHDVYPEFDPKQAIPPGDDWSFTFLNVGQWRFHDHLHPEITGLIRVHGVATNAPQRKTVASGQFSDSTGLEEIDSVVAAGNKQQLNELLTSYGVKAVIKDLMQEIGPEPSFDCHSLMHSVGHAAYDVYGINALSESTDFCHSGFYHGAIEKMLSVEGTSDIASTAERLCKTSETAFQRHQCLHGIGHGVLAYLDYNLPEALSVCGALLGDDPRRCYGGIFMENIMQAKGFGAVEGHATTWVSDDPHFPCNAIDAQEKVQQECYKMQTTWMTVLFEGNTDNILAECSTLTGISRSSCFTSVGRQAAGIDRSGSTINALCAKAPESGDAEACIAGALHVVVDFAGSALSDEASLFCSSLPDGRKKACYSTLAGRLPGLFSDQQRVNEVCGTFESAFQYLCQK